MNIYLFINKQLAMGTGREVTKELVAQANTAFYDRNPRAPMPLEQQTPQGRKWSAEWAAAYRAAERTAEGLPPIPLHQPTPDLCGYFNFHGKRKTSAAFALYCPGNADIVKLPNGPILRCFELAQAVQVAAEQLKRICDPDDTLPVFVAPEAYFQKLRHSRPGQYDQTEFNSAIQILRNLSRAYPNMLIIPGSFAWYKPAAKSAEDPGYEKIRIKPPHLWPPEMFELVQNTAPVLFGGRVYYYTKREEVGNIMYEHQRYDLPPIPGPHNTTGGFFAVCGLTFGLRICADDPESLPDYRATFPSGKGVDFHILIAYGQDINRDNSAVRHGGCIVRVDSGPGSWEKRCTVRHASYRLDHTGRPAQMGDHDRELLLVDEKLPLVMTPSAIRPE